MSEANYPLQTMIEGSIKPSRATMHGFMVIYWPSNQNQKQKRQMFDNVMELGSKTTLDLQSSL
jgi:hypothetical protein